MAGDIELDAIDEYAEAQRFVVSTEQQNDRRVFSDSRGGSPLDLSARW
jgi:hypothetical protein